MVVRPGYRFAECLTVGYDSPVVVTETAELADVRDDFDVPDDESARRQGRIIEQLGVRLMNIDTRILGLDRDAAPPVDGILSRTIFRDDEIKAVIAASVRPRAFRAHGGETGDALRRPGTGQRRPG